MDQDFMLYPDIWGQMGHLEADCSASLFRCELGHEAKTESQTVSIRLKTSRSCNKSMISFRGYSLSFTANRNTWTLLTIILPSIFEMFTGLMDLQGLKFELFTQKIKLSLTYGKINMGLVLGESWLSLINANNDLKISQIYVHALSTLSNI